jgi:protoporphyrinogen oxidase
MKQTAVELLKQRLIKDQQVFPIYNEYINGILYDINNELLEMEKQQQGYSEEEMLKMLHKFGFDYTYNYKGEKTIYEWIPEWFEEYKRLEQLNK